MTGKVKGLERFLGAVDNLEPQLMEVTSGQWLDNDALLYYCRTGKVKGLERFLGAVDNLEPQLMEVTSGQAKYEHQHRAIVWRMPRLPKEGQVYECRDRLELNALCGPCRAICFLVSYIIAYYKK
ncbi:hypothetical protein J6590_008669 [Homalodisca vitripennis]|nr:hypothetical protein J6590_008669 [Homalodisca vitripennis]